MKKLILILAIGLITITAKSQNLNREHLLLYADTISMSGGDTLIRSVYAFLPVFKPLDTTYYFPYQRIYTMNGKNIPWGREHFEGKYNEIITFGSTDYTLQELYDFIKQINEQYWQTAMWGIFMQKVNNQ